MNRNSLIVRNCSLINNNSNNGFIKVEKHDLDVEFQSNAALEAPQNKYRRVICNGGGGNLPRIAIKREQNEIILVNGCWDTSNKIPNIIAEMHNVNMDEFQIEFNANNQFEVGPATVEQQSKNCFLLDSPIGSVNKDSGGATGGSDSGIDYSTTSTGSTTSDATTDGNLSWLLNYKIHELPPVPDVAASEQFCKLDRLNDSETVPRFANTPNATTKQNNLSSNNKDDLDSSTNQRAPASAHSYRYSGPKKPPFTYTELIEHALNEKGELTVSGIYQWISDHFPFYKQTDDRWKNSVRHNLSINPHFRKGGKAVHGAGHLWTIAQRDEKKALQIKQRMTQFIQNAYKDSKNAEQEAFDKELQAATESILGESFKAIQNDMEEKKENIEVEYINLIDVSNGLEDFLSPPVSKQEIVQECGLGNDFFITDINPNTLGLNLVGDGQGAAHDNLYEEMTFEYYDLNQSSHQSAHTNHKQ